MAECDLRERQRKERMKQAEFEKYAKEHNLFICTTNILEQIRAEIQKEHDVLLTNELFTGDFYEGMKGGLILASRIINQYTKGEPNDKRRSNISS